MGRDFLVSHLKEPFVNQIFSSFQDSEVFPRRAALELLISCLGHPNAFKAIQENLFLPYLVQWKSNFQKLIEDDDWEVKLRVHQFFSGLWKVQTSLFFQFSADQLLLCSVSSSN